MAAQQIAVDFFTELAAVASDHGTCLCIEANAPEYGCDFVTNLREAVDLVTCVGCSGFGLHVDAGVMTMNGEGGDELFHAVLPHMRHFHISEPFLGTITAGQTDHPLLGRQLREAGFSGWKSIEMRSGLGESNPRMVEECLRYAVACYG
jgi:sugar phosphate isomerase/epimerase